MNIQTFQLKSDRKSICEDYYICDEKKGLFAVLDGATPISDFVDQEGRNGAVLASRIVGNVIKNSSSFPLQSRIFEANSLLLEEMKKHNIDLTKKEELWCTCLAMVIVDDKSIHFAQIGDCMIFASTKSGEIKRLTEDMVSGISKRAMLQREKERREGKDLPNEDFYGAPKNAMIYNRSLANQENGYGVLNGDPAAENFLHVGMLPREEYSEILLISDGLFSKDRNWEDMFNMIREHGLPQYATDLVEYELSNNLLQDDKTGILIKF